MTYIVIANMLKEGLTTEQIIKYLPTIFEAVDLATNKGERLGVEASMQIQTLIERIRSQE